MGREGNKSKLLTEENFYQELMKQKKWDAKETSPNYAHKVFTKENFPVKGGGEVGGVRGRMWSARKSMMAEFQPLVLACSIFYCHAQSTNFSKVLFIFLKRTDKKINNSCIID